MRNNVKRIRMQKTGFGWWMLNNMDERGWSCTDVAEKLHTTRQSVNNHTYGKNKPSYMQVVAYCWVFDFKDNPDDIWELVQGEES